MRDIYIRLGLVLILLLSLYTYFPSFKAELLTIKDPVYVQDNEAIQALNGEKLQEIFFSLKESYYPLTLLSYSLDYYFMQLDPFAFHCTNIFLHLMNILLVFLFIFQLLHDSKQENAGIIALFTAALFGLATGQVVSVAWVSERKTLLYSFFYLLSLIQYLKYHRSHSRFAIHSSLFLFILAAAASVKALSLLLVLPAIDYYYKKHFRFRYFWKGKISFITATLFFVILNITALLSHTKTYTEIAYGFFDHVVLAFYNYCFYIQKSIYTSSSLFALAYPEKIQGNLPHTFFLYIIPVVLLGFLIFRFLRKNKLLILALYFFSVHILIYQIMSPLSMHMLEVSHLYLPAIGIYLFLVSLIFYLKKIHVRMYQIFGIVLVLFIVFSAYKSHKENYIWKNTLGLSQNIMREDPRNLKHLINSNLFHINTYPKQEGSSENSESFGIEERERRIKSEEIEKFLESIEDPINTEKGHSQHIQLLLEKIRKTSKSSKTYQKYMSELIQAYFERGIARGKQGAYAESNRDFDRVIKLNPEHADAYFNKAYNLYKTGILFEALDYLNTALDINPAFVKAYAFRGEIRTNIGDFNNALNDFDSVIMKNPKYPMIREARNKCVYIFENNLRAMDMIFRKEYDAAIAYYDLGIDRNPELTVLYSNRGYVRAEKGDIQGAIQDFNKALELCKDYPFAYNNRAYAYLKAGDTGQALEDVNKSLMLDAENPYTYRTRALIYIELKQTNEACSDLQKALDLNYTDLYDDEVIRLMKKHCKQK